MTRTTVHLIGDETVIQTEARFPVIAAWHGRMRFRIDERRAAAYRYGSTEQMTTDRRVARWSGFTKPAVDKIQGAGGTAEVS